MNTIPPIVYLARPPAFPTGYAAAFSLYF